MIETREVRKLFTGPPEVTATLVHQARVLLGMLKNDMAFNSLPQGERTLRLQVNKQLLDYSDNPERTIERRAEGTAVITAGSIFGQDWIAIDATDVTVTVIPPTEGEYIPYLWVGVRTEGEGSPAFENGFRDDLYNNVMLHVFEPIDDEILQDIQASPQDTVGGDYMASSVNYFFERLRLSTSSSFANQFEDEFYEDVPFEFKMPLDVHYSINNLYQVGHGIAPLVSPANDDSKPWQKAVVLDPGDPEKEFDSTAPYMYGNFDYPAKPIASPLKWQLKGEVQPGKYLVKVQIENTDECHADPGTLLATAGPALDVIVKVRVGKAPGVVTEHEKRVSFSKYQWSPYFRDIFPGGDCNECTPEAPDYGAGPNPHGSSWWQGGFLVDVQNGTIQLVEDKELVPEWGFEAASAPTVKQICWRVDHYNEESRASIRIDTETNGMGPPDIQWRGRVLADHLLTWVQSSSLWQYEEVKDVQICGEQSGNHGAIQVGNVNTQVLVDWTGWIPDADTPKPFHPDTWAAFWTAKLGGWTAGDFQGEGGCWFRLNQRFVKSFPEGEDHGGQFPAADNTGGTHCCGPDPYEIFTLLT